MTNQEKINEFILKHCENCDKNTEKCKITINRKGKAQCTEEKNIK